MTGINRQKSLAASKAKFYCGCDRGKVGQYGKCSKCGKKSGKRQGKIKVPTIDSLDRN